MKGNHKGGPVAGEMNTDEHRYYPFSTERHIPNGIPQNTFFLTDVGINMLLAERKFNSNINN